MQKELFRINELMNVDKLITYMLQYYFCVYAIICGLGLGLGLGLGDFFYPLLDNSNKISAASLVELSMSTAETGLFCTLLLWVLLPELIVLQMLSIFLVSIFETLVDGEGFSFTLRQRGSTGCGPGKLPILQKVNELKKRRSTGFCSEHKSPI